MGRAIVSILCSESVIKHGMPMLRGCTFPDCETLTLSAYCLEHELFIRTEIQVDRTRDAESPPGMAREGTAGPQVAA
jgi:hypothetical protein